MNILGFQRVSEETMQGLGVNVQFHLVVNL